MKCTHQQVKKAGRWSVLSCTAPLDHKCQDKRCALIKNGDYDGGNDAE